MAVFLQENLGTIIAGLLVAAAVILVIVKMLKNKKAGKSSCGGCAGCPNEANCHHKDGCGRYRGKE